MTRRHADLGHRARPRAAAGARHARRLPALGEPLRLAARDRGGRVPRPAGRASSGSRCRCPSPSARSSRPRSSGTCCSALGGMIGADARVPTMVLLRAPLGRRGSYLPTGLNILQCLGWSVFELIVIATGASALSQQLFGFGGVAVLEDPLRRRRDRARVPRPGRLRAQVRAQVRGVGRDRLARLSLLVVAARPASGRALASPRRARVLAGLRPRARVDHQLDAARRRLHALLPHARGRASGAPGSATSCRRSRSSRSAR